MRLGEEHMRQGFAVPAVSVIVAVYKKPDFLEKILASLKNQSFRDFEVIVADDGSGPEIAEVVRRFTPDFSTPIRHVWHEDKGFRKTVIANQAVLASRAQYLIFVDGDSICHRRFVESHFRFRKPGIVLSGRRIMLNKELSERMTLDDVKSGRIERLSYWWRHCDKGHRKHGFFIPVLFFIENFFKTKYSILGCNFSMHKDDYCAINGYDERIIGRGMEDSNIDARFRLKGVRIKSVTRQALQYHLFHNFDPVPHGSEAIREFCFPKEYWTPWGLVQRNTSRGNDVKAARSLDGAMKIAILDPRIHAPGLVKVFPGADYFVIGRNGVYDLDKTPQRFRDVYGFDYREDLERITGDRYDALFIVYACLDFRERNRPDVQYHLEKILAVVSANHFKHIVGFSNDDAPFDPAIECNYLKAGAWFKRNYQSTKQYLPNVYPFPFIIFGHVCPLWRVLTENRLSKEKIDRVLWAGNTHAGRDPRRNPDYLSRRELYHSPMKRFLTTIDAPNQQYLQEVSRSLFAMDMNGEGDPNYRTFELLTTDTLILQQFKYLVWPFEDGDGFSEETIYKTPEEFIEKLGHLRADTDLYNRCLANQKYIKAKYFTQEWLRAYLLKHISISQ